MSPCAHIDRTPEKALICHHYQVVPHLQTQHHCLRKRESMHAAVPQSLGKDHVEDRKPMELVPPSGTKSNCW